MSADTRDEALRMAREIVDVLGPNVPRSVTDTGARWEWQHALELARSLASTLAAPVEAASAPVESERQIVDLNNSTISPAPPAGAVEDGCPVCNGDCAAANPPPYNCPNATPAARQGGEADAVAAEMEAWAEKRMSGPHDSRLVRRLVTEWAKRLRGTDADEDAYVIEQMGRLLAEIAVIVNGPEPANGRWSYHDLPAKVAALSARPAAGDGAVWLMPVATDAPQNPKLQRYAWGRSNLTDAQMAHAYDCIVSAAQDCGQVIAPPAREGVPEGMVLVPREPTPECLAAGASALGALYGHEGARRAYIAMLAAAPTAGEGSKDA